MKVYVKTTVSVVPCWVIIHVNVLAMVIMDILKYCFGIDLTHEDREQLREEKRKRKRKPIIQRFVYVDAPPSSSV